MKGRDDVSEVLRWKLKQAMERLRAAALRSGYSEPLAEAERVKILLGQIWQYERSGTISAVVFDDL